jgi:hypothetical protein
MNARVAMAKIGEKLERQKECPKAQPEKICIIV